MGFPLVAFILLHFSSKTNFWEVIALSHLNFKAVSIGLGIGVVGALLGLLLIKILPESKLNNMLDGVMKNLNPQWYHVLFYSFCAGVGEEILFRGAIQSFIHLWPTAVVFVAIHGYLNIKDKPMFVYGIFLIFVSGAFGYLHKFLGIYAAIAAHFIYDVIMFGYMKLADDK